MKTNKLNLRYLLAILFVVVASAANGQIHFSSITPASPCPSDVITFFIPTQEPNGGCAISVTNAAKITVSPSSISPYKHFNTQYMRYDYVELTNTTGQNVSVTVEYTCPGSSTAKYIYDLVTMKTALTANPTITGPAAGNIYIGDAASSLSASIDSPASTTFAWSLTPVTTNAGTITSAAIASPSAQSTNINWPSTYAGVVDITVTATRCGTSRTSTAKRITVNPLPYVTFTENGANVSAPHCSGEVRYYEVVRQGPFTFNSVSPATTGGATEVTAVKWEGSIPVRWSVKWTASGTIRAAFDAKDGSRTWNGRTSPTITYTMLQLNPGTINTPSSTPICGPTSVTLTTSVAPVDGGYGYAWQSCTGNCGVETNWVNNSPLTSSTFSIMGTTLFRIKLSSPCGSTGTTSNVVTYNMKPTPQVTMNDSYMFSGGTFTIPNATEAGSTINVTIDPTTVTGASAVSGLTGTFATQTLSSTSVAGATVKYYITPSLNGCTGTTKTATITVFKKPQVYASHKGIYKEFTQVTLSTDAFTSSTFQWKKKQTPTDASLGTSATQVTTDRGDFKIFVTKNGVTGESDWFTVGDQFDGINNNYILTRQPSIKITSTTGIENRLEDEVTEDLKYFDGIGRPIQSISVRNSPNGHKDLVQPIIYDQYGREQKKYLPYVSDQDNGRLQSDAITVGQPTFYQGTSMVATDDIPYSKTNFEASPLNRPLEDFGAGKKWTDDNKRIQHAYPLNTHGTAATANLEKIITWSFDANGLPIRNTALNSGYYPTGYLIINSTKDEQGNEVREYTDKIGHIVAKKVYATGTSNIFNTAGNWAETDYIYNDLGLLVYVLQPELANTLLGSPSANPTSTQLTNYAFQYQYDERGRMKTKRVPGADWTYMVYDNRDRLVYTQDGNQRLNKQWAFTKYDDLNRAIATGIKDTTATVDQATMQNVVNTWYKTRQTRWGEVRSTAVGSVHGYTNRSYPYMNEISRYYTITYYDDYAWKTSLYNNARFNFSSSELSGEQETAAKTRVVGLATGGKVKVLDGGTNWQWSVTYYDSKDRIIQTIADNIKAGTDRVTNVLDFNGKVLKTKSVHVDQDVTWKDRVGISIAGNRVGGSSATPGWGYMGGASVQVLPASTFGTVEVTVNEVSSNAWAVGLSTSNPDANVNTINYGVGINNSTLYTYENSTGTNRGTVARGDVLKVIRAANGAVNFYKNDVWITAAATSSTAAMMVDMAMYSPVSMFSNVTASFGSKTHTIVREFKYDHVGRLVKMWHTYNSEPKVLLISNSYNELGQLIDKKLHSANNGTTGKQSIDYRYNIRGWLTSINGADLTGGTSVNDDNGTQARDFFGMDLLYEKTDAVLGTSSLYNGNISAIKWSNNLGLDDAKQNSYKFGYDALNRITLATFAKKTATWANLTNAFNESNYAYDLNGNIQSLTRNGEAANMDVLAYDYGSTDKSNRLLKVSDTGNKALGFTDGANAGNDYTYDANGNMITDLNKGVLTNITYNHLNLPANISRGSSSGAIAYVYDAAGKKLSQVTAAYAAQKQVDYAGEYEYLEDELQSIQHDEGRIQIKGRKQVFYSDGTQTAGLTCTSCTLTAVTQNTNQTYLKLVSGGTTARTGIANIAGSIPVTAGEKYLVRAKGYSVSYEVFILAQVNGTDVSISTKMPQLTADAESWTEAVVTIPTTGTLTTGVVWPTVISGSTFYLNDFEVLKITDVTPEYQYNLKDQLGNVRLTFTTKRDVETFQAGYETADATTESATFNPSYSNATIVSGAVYNHTSGGSRSQRLTASASEIIGLAKSVKVLPGDTLNAEVYAKYLTPTTTNTNVPAQIFAAMASAFGVTATSVGDGAILYQALNTLNGAGLLMTAGSGVDEGQPKAYLNYILFDKDYIPYDMGFKQVTSSASSAHELLTLSAKPTKPGYAYFYISNENGKIVEVYFDDFKLQHMKSPIVSSQDYYPFGLTFNSFNRETSIKNQYKFQGQENQDELDLNWDSFKWRNSMPEIGRFFNIDPLSEKYVYNSPYAFSENKVIAHNELEGLESISVQLGGRIGSVTTLSYAVGIAADFEGNVMLYQTYSAGGGVGAFAGVGIDINIGLTGNVDNILGTNINAGYNQSLDILPGPEFGVSVSSSIEDGAPGISGGLPKIASLRTGAAIGFLAYLDVSYTEELGRTTWSEIGDVLKSWSSMIKDETGKTISIDVEKFKAFVQTKLDEQKQKSVDDGVKTGKELEKGKKKEHRHDGGETNGLDE